jgi:LuxR family maltose regulon positive regulatory protein
METPLLKTKLHIPQIRDADLVPRPILMTRLTEGLQGKLTLVAAPPGFGKTTLVSQWLALLRLQDKKFVNRSAWLSLDENDNDPARFLAYTVAALQTVAPQVGRSLSGMLTGPHPPSIEALLTALINDIAGLQAPLLLVLDDYHLVTTPTIQAGLTFLLDNMPQQMHLVITCRAEPSLPLARLRARGQLIEIRADDLRFSVEEAAHFLTGVMGLDLAGQDVAALEDRTEGWVAGLQLAALSLKKQTDQRRFVAEFTGSHRYILDYLADEVLRQQPAEILDFLLKTAVLERMCASLCEAVLGRGDVPVSPASEAMLETLEAANLFIIPLDDERRWYRYHHLFADLLRHRLQQAYPDQVAGLHQRAALWYRERGLLAEAIHHALQAKEYAFAAPLIEDMAMPALLRAEPYAVSNWLKQLPERLIQTRPWLCVLDGWILLIKAIGQEEARLVEVRLQQAEARLEGHEDKARLAVYIAVMWSYVAQVRGDLPAAIEHARLAQAQLSSGDLVLRSFTALSLGTSYAYLGNLKAAQAALEEAEALGVEIGNAFTAWVSRDHLARLQVERGRLVQAVEQYRQAIGQVIGQPAPPSPVAGIYYIELADILREWNDLDEAIQMLQQGFELIRQGSLEEMMVLGYLIQARIVQAQGDGPGALARIEQAEALLRKHELSVFPAWVGAVRTRIYLCQGYLIKAALWAQTCNLPLNDEAGLRQHPGEYTTLVRVLIAQGDSVALTLLERMQRVMEDDGRQGRVIEVLALQALARQSQGDTEQALEALAQSLSLAEAGGYMRLYLDEGEPMARLLAQLPASPYRDKILARFAALQVKDENIVKRKSEIVNLPEALTAREVQILGLIAAGLSNKEIAEELVLSLSTVKWYTSSIYGKLGVRRRTEAVERGRSLEII